MFRAVQREAGVVSRGLRVRQSLNTAVADIFAKIAASQDGPAIVQEIRNTLAQENPAFLASIEESLKQLELGVSAVPLIEKLRAVAPFVESAAAEMPTETPLVGLSRGLLGVVHSEFNRAFQALDSRGPEVPGGGSDLLAPFEAGLEEFAGKLREGQLTLKDTLRDLKSASDAIPAACTLAGLVEDHQPRLARLQARAFFAARNLIDQGTGAAAERLGDVAARAGFLSREALSTHVACYRTVLELLGPDPGQDVRELQQRAGQIEFDANLPNGLDVDLSKLDQVQDGTFVEVRGFVTHQEVVRNISRVEVTDPSSGASARAAVVFTQLAHAGLTKGAFCRINGTLRKATNLLDGDPGIEIDKLPLVKLGAKSWRIALLRLSQPWFQVWRNGVNMIWALGPHHRTREDPESFVGAGELIFPPFMRQTGGDDA
jgi:hypothetical protein